MLPFSAVAPKALTILNMSLSGCAKPSDSPHYIIPENHMANHLLYLQAREQEMSVTWMAKAHHGLPPT